MALAALARRGTLAGAVAILLAAYAGPASAADLKVGANIGNVPWEFQDSSGNYVGFEIDLVNEIGKRLGQSVEIVSMPFQDLFAAVESGKVDAAVSSITITAKRLASFSFAQPYYDSDQSLTVTAASGITTLEGLKGKVVAVESGSTGDLWATAHRAEYGFAAIHRFEGLAPAMLDLEAGRIDGYVSDIPAVLYYTKDKPALAVIERIPTGEKYSIMFAKDSPLATKVNDILDQLKKEGYLAALHETWLGAKADQLTSTVQPAVMPKAR